MEENNMQKYIVWYKTRSGNYSREVVVPSYRLVWYNMRWTERRTLIVVVPSYRLVWYNYQLLPATLNVVVVPSYRLVWYNSSPD